VIGALNRLWHQYVKSHYIVFHPAIRPDRVIRDGAGKPLINVFEQNTFQRPGAYHECNCGKTWASRR
jgi:hypothetical protein